MKSGSRFAPDVVGVRIENGELHIVHVETGIYNSLGSSARIPKKFGDELCREVEHYFRKCLDCKLPSKYEKILIYRGRRPEASTVKDLRAISLDDFVKMDLRDALKEYLVTTGSTTLPDGDWILDFARHAWKHDLINKKSLGEYP